ncbi:hypothetical protein B0H14DRAFT_2865514 [Mycena olivaceomarginata]|nr:hypothetical protein B0H14DRAFT_2865514 [Mycena olivaceomarginata]
MQRPLISYDDITLPYQPAPPEPAPRAANAPSGPSQLKKRKWSKDKSNKNNNNKAASVQGPGDDDDGEDADSRYLTQEEIWDDSALINAWDAATEEYEALNGPDKGWKKEPVHRSPLWYNTQPTKPPNKKIKIEAADADAEGEGDSKPLDFDSFVPSHDAALPVPAPSGAPEAAGYAAYGSAPPLPGVGVASQDEAFTRALEAMYWGGYWTAVYHCHRGVSRTEALGEGVAADDGDGDGDGDEDVDSSGGEEEEEEEFVPTQR